jgi:hypothetical protein
MIMPSHRRTLITAGHELRLTSGTPQAIRRGTHRSVRELIEAITAFIDGWNDRCQPFVWTKDADTIIAEAHRQSTSGTRH